MKEIKVKTADKPIIKVILALLIILLVICLLIFLFLPKNTTITNNAEQESALYLICDGSGEDADYALLKGYYSNDVTFNIRIKYLGNSLDMMDLVASKRFGDLASAKDFSDELEASYNKYLGEHGLSRGIFTPSFSYVDNIGKMSLFLAGSYLDYKTAPLFLLNSEITANTSIFDVKTFYENKSFSCSVE